MRIAMIGTRGVPPRYGGFETAVDEVGRRLVDAGHEVVVYCRNPGQTPARPRRACSWSTCRPCAAARWRR